MGEGCVNLITYKYLIPSNCKQLAGEETKHRFALLLSLLIYYVINVNELFVSQEAKQTTEFGVGVEDTYSICYQPCMSDEALQIK